jgi:hypothetical protein
MSHWREQYPSGFDVRVHFDMNILQQGLTEGLGNEEMRYCPPCAAPKKTGHPKSN